jgi:coatomer subunit delta
MVVLSASICTKSGKALISRQFVEMTRIRIEGLLAAFPKLIGDAKQHTFVETEAVRYVYQPMENFYLLVITNRASNIIEDLETLRLLSKVVPQVCGASNNITESDISKSNFDIIFAFDEVITTGGYREPITLQQIRTNMEMESHEETLHNMIKMSKMESAKDKARDAAKIIHDRQSESAMAGKSMQAMGGMVGIGGGSNSISSESRQTAPSVVPASASQASSHKPTSRAPVKGMSLIAKGAKNKSLEDALVKEDKLAPVIQTSSSVVDSKAGGAPVLTAIQHPIMLSIVEKVSARLSRDGVVESFDIKGNLTLTAADDEVSKCSVQLKAFDGSSFTFNTHPKVDKAQYDGTRLLQLKDSSKGFPSSRPVGILKWTYNGSADDVIPIKVNCWPEEESRGRMNVTIEYTMETPRELHNVLIRVPVGTSDSPEIVSIDGSHSFSAANRELVWQIALMDSSNSSGSLEFNISQKLTDAFFPIQVEFSSQALFCDVGIDTIRSAETGAPIMYGMTKMMSSEDYTIE